MSELCKTCGGELVCLCGQTESSQGWPCTHGGCHFVCPECCRREEACRALEPKP
jgi:hypothetical protein